MALSTTPDSAQGGRGGRDGGADAGDAGDAGGRPPVRARARLGSRRRRWIALALVAAALLILVFQGLGNATVYFKTADEAVAQRAKLGGHRFRIEGTVQPGVHQVGDATAFVIANNGANVSVLHHGDQPQLFKPGIPVVLEGHFDASGTFASDLIMVKHTESYVAKHPDRVSGVPATIPGSSSPPATSAP
ncbi:MAG TPA: cytochrome c maturation protein CcmE [Acidimicrobiales bacterium]|nr:cytochrome c maturation protein CcmE [Acidimicrobiales bacterium]